MLIQTELAPASSTEQTRAQLAAVLAWYASLSPATLARVAEFYQPQARFKDPFNEVVGHAGIEAIFQHMFATTEGPRFIIGEQLVDGRQAFVTWVFEFSLKGQLYAVTGSSHLVFGADGLLRLHRDYWDAAEELLQKLPVVGAPIRWLRRQFKLPAHPSY
ncbi:nuclear transport factor 2 family protein [Chitinibacter tainanensis]|uniref:nuclear transport factor 2 family protein n=1 Tax=Chitinibacter tainanensis TaxID=230667 RepID=UPI00235565A2|nr:nuclear transport factor 2 family protein [Chitinibacter tainanensis]